MIPESRAACRALTSGGVLGLSLLILVGCGGTRVMMPTPNVHLDTERDFYAELHHELKSTEVPLFYVTDRVPEKDDDGELRYGHGRSASLAFGGAVVDLGVNLTWDRSCG